MKNSPMAVPIRPEKTTVNAPQPAQSQRSRDKQIASELELTVPTVLAHISNAFF